MKITAEIKNWTIVKADGGLYIKGHAFSHINPDYAEDGDLILTSRIVNGQDGYIQTECGVYKIS